MQHVKIGWHIKDLKGFSYICNSASTEENIVWTFVMVAESQEGLEPVKKVCLCEKLCNFEKILSTHEIQQTKEGLELVKKFYLWDSA